MAVDLSGRMYVVGSVSMLHPDAQTVNEMLEVERFIEATNEFPWTWRPSMVEEFFSDLHSVKRRKWSTVRGYQNALLMFYSYVSPDYGWDRVGGY